MLAAKSFYYLRHGETDWNRAHRAQGHVDMPLNDTGVAQAEAAAVPLRGSAIATICCSPLLRARETAEIVNRTLGRPLVVFDELKECGFGVCEGLPRGSWLADWRRGITPEGAEPYDFFMARALVGINKALAQPGPVLIVAHAGVYWAIQRHGALDPAAQLPNACPVRHDPPSAEIPGWTVTVMERAGHG